MPSCIKNLQAIILLIIFCISITACSKKTPEAVPPKPVFVKFEPVSYQAITQEFETAGELKADKQITVSAEWQGQIEQILVSEGSAVKRGSPLIKIKGQDVEAELKMASANYESYKKLYEEGAISRQEFIKYETALEKVSSNISNLYIRSISDGVIGEIYVDPGDYVRLGDPILEVVKVYPLRVTYSVPERLISYITLGQKVELSSDAFPAKIFNASVDFISPSVDQSTRALMVRATLTNANSLLKANQFMNVKQTIQNKDKSLLVREEAIYIDQGQEYLYLAESKKQTEKQKTNKTNPNQGPAPTHVAKRVAIKTGLRKPGYVEIVEGINEGDLVVYAGLTSIYPGADLIQVIENE